MDDRTRERRQLTILFCDLVDSTLLSNQLDAEDYGELIDAFRGTCEATVQRLGGHVAQYLGDGVLVYFGYPVAQENAAVNAIRAGRALVDAVSDLNTERGLQAERSLGIRLGIHTGVVVAGKQADGRGSELALGSAPNLAARLQALATPNSVVVSGETRRLTRGFFDFKSLGEHRLKGVPELVSAYQVGAARPVQSRFDVELGAGLSPLVGRQESLTLLREEWNRVHRGESRSVLVSGEAGVGKSRLVFELRGSLPSGTRWIQAACSEHAKNRPYYCVAAAVGNLAGFAESDGADERSEKLARLLEANGFDEPSALQLVASVVGVKLPTDYAVPPALGPAEIRSRTLQTLIDLLLRTSEKEPIVVCFEDLHWVDPTSEELIARAAQAAGAGRLLCICTFRPTYRADWAAQRFQTMELEPLPQDAALLLSAELLDAQPTSRVARRIAELSDGIPLFAEELARATLETEHEAEPESVDVPPTLQDSLMARLDRLPEGKQLAQLASVCGRHVSEALLRSAFALDSSTIDAGIQQLLDAGIFYRVGASEYAFKHGLVQDSAHASMLKRTCRHYHRLVAEAMLSESEGTAAEPDVIAFHLDVAGDAMGAVDQWIRAAQQSVDRAANLEAERHLASAEQSLGQVHSGPEKSELELKFQMVSGQLAIMTSGYASERAERAYTRALELCRTLDTSTNESATKLLASRVLCADDLVKARPDPGPAFWVLWGLGAFHQARAEHRRALLIGKGLLTLAAGKPELMVEGHFGSGSSLYHLGEFESAARHLEEGWAAQAANAQAVSPTGHRADILCLGYLSFTRWHLGDVDLADRDSSMALDLARQTGHPFVVASGHAMRARFLQLIGDAHGALREGSAALELAVRFGFGFVETWSRPIVGWGRVQTADDPDGVRMIQEALTAYGPDTTRVLQPYVLGLLAECQLRLGSFEEAVRHLDEGLALADRLGERFWEPELFRLRGVVELARSEGDPKAARMYLVRALRQAHEQRATSTERRVTIDTSKLPVEFQWSEAQARSLVAGMRLSS